MGLKVENLVIKSAKRSVQIDFFFYTTILEVNNNVNQGGIKFDGKNMELHIKRRDKSQIAKTCGL